MSTNDLARDLVSALDGYEALTIGLDGARQWTGGFPFAVTRAAKEAATAAR